MMYDLSSLYPNINFGISLKDKGLVKPRQCSVCKEQSMELARVHTKHSHRFVCSAECMKAYMQAGSYETITFVEEK